MKLVSVYTVILDGTMYIDKNTRVRAIKLPSHMYDEKMLLRVAVSEK